jgi:uncharacterized protein
MPVYLSPGVYIEEVPSRARPIEGVATSVAAFIGRAPRGTAGEAKRITKLDDYRTEYGEIADEHDHMGFAVQAFYQNGGKTAYICRLVGVGSAAAAAGDILVGEGTGGTPTTEPVFRVSARNEGEWGNNLFIRLVKPDSDTLALTLEIGHQEEGKFVVDEAFAGLTMRPADDTHAPIVVNSESNLVTLALGPAADPDNAAQQFQSATLRGGELDGAVADYFSGAGFGVEILSINLNGRGTEQVAVDLSSTTFSDATDAADKHNADGQTVAAAIEVAIRAHNPLPVYQAVTCTYDTGAHRFMLASPHDQPNASVEIHSGNLANRLRMDRRTTGAHRAVLTGAQRPSNSTLFSNATSGIPSLSDTSLTVDIDNHGPVTFTIDPDSLSLTGNNAADGQAVAQAIQNAIQAVDPRVAAYRHFTCIYSPTPNRHFVLTSGSQSPRVSGLTVVDSPLATLLGLDSGSSPTLVLGRELDQGSARVIPRQVLGLNDQGHALSGGTEEPPTANDYTNFYSSVLRKVHEVTVLVTPSETWNAEGPNPVVSATLAHAEAMKNRMVIVDPPKGRELIDPGVIDAMSLPTSTYSVLYYPWVRVTNPFFNEETNPTASKTVLVPPSAFAAGIWSRTDGTRGVWKAPAGVEARLTGAVALEFAVEEGEQEVLNPLGVNAYRHIPGFGPVIWGARTLSTKAAPEWRYVPVRRTALFIEQSIYNGIQWAVFEPNDHPLWSSLRANIGAFMNGLFRAGAFQGKTADEAYFVRCNLGDTMEQEDIDRGQVIVLVGFAPLKPAEFVIVRIQQKVAQQ